MQIDYACRDILNKGLLPVQSIKLLSHISVLVPNSRALNTSPIDFEMTSKLFGISLTNNKNRVSILKYV